jgi:hypothetical protein
MPDAGPRQRLVAPESGSQPARTVRAPDIEIISCFELEYSKPAGRQNGGLPDSDVQQVIARFASGLFIRTMLHDGWSSGFRNGWIYDPTFIYGSTGSGQRLKADHDQPGWIVLGDRFGSWEHDGCLELIV